jgi:hypothetical protein
MKRWILFALLVAAPAAPQPADRKAVMELMQLVIPETSYKLMIDQMTVQMFAQLKQSGANLPPDAPQRLKAAVLEVVPYKENLEWSADVYQQKFTTKEIADLKKFYLTPTGKKAARLIPEIGAEIGKRMGQIIPERMGPALKKQGLVPAQ